MQQRETTQAARLVLSSGDLVLRSLPLLGERVSIGRRPYNDMALDDLTVSGEHALVLRLGNGPGNGPGNSLGNGLGNYWRVRDLRSRNGTLVNGSPIVEQVLQDGDLIDIGVYRIKFVGGGSAAGDDDPPAASSSACVELLNGPSAGTRINLDRAINSIGATGTQVAVIARRRNGYFVTHLEGLAFPLVNGEPIGLLAHPLAHNDLIELGGTMMRFRLVG
ncbi:MAG TPA: FHA domain-containing protein [Burkholderiaceae bacterium]|nr:FHA domain-containing protein [Burkholderiaceae bacterium]